MYRFLRWFLSGPSGTSIRGLDVAHYDASDSADLLAHLPRLRSLAVAGLPTSITLSQVIDLHICLEDHKAQDRVNRIPSCVPGLTALHMGSPSVCIDLSPLSRLQKLRALALRPVTVDYWVSLALLTHVPMTKLRLLRLPVAPLAMMVDKWQDEEDHPGTVVSRTPCPWSARTHWYTQ